MMKFSFPAGTSRGVLHEKPSWIIKLFDDINPLTVGYGECSIIPNLSIDHIEQMDLVLNRIDNDLANQRPINSELLHQFPSISFGLETAFADLLNGGKRILFPSAFTDGSTGIPINGLIWMGDVRFMKEQIAKKIDAGFSCLKMKIGAIGFDDEIAILREIRQSFSPSVLELRVDANGAFCEHDVFEKLDILHQFNLHSIEQPVKAGQWELMRQICEKTPFPVALDEELIGVSNRHKMSELIHFINPQYIILKPGLLGGFEICDQWIELAVQHNTGWWITSALEGNIGLNAIAQYTYSKNNPFPQGLGTGQLFTNNIDSPLTISKGALFYQPQTPWGDLSI